MKLFGSFPLSSLSLFIFLPFMTASIEYDVTLIVGGSPGYVDGIGTNAYNSLGSIRISPNGVFALFTEFNFFFIRKIDISTASVTTIAGGPDDDAIGPTNPTPGIGTNSKFNVPAAVAISPDNSYALVADSGNNLIRYIDLSSDFVTTLAGMITPGHTDGVGINSAFDAPFGVAISPDGRYALVTDFNNNLIRHIDLSTVTVITLAGVVGAGRVDGIGTNSNFHSPSGIIISTDGSFALVADSGNHIVRRIDLSTVSVTTLAGDGVKGRLDGQGTNARFTTPFDVSISPNCLYALVADLNGNLVRRIDISTGTVTRAAGVITESDPYYEPGSSLFLLPLGISIAPDDSYALVVDFVSIRKLTIPAAPAEPTMAPSVAPSSGPSISPTIHPTTLPSSHPSTDPTVSPSLAPSSHPTLAPSFGPSVSPTLAPSDSPSFDPAATPTVTPSSVPTSSPTFHPSSSPTLFPTFFPILPRIPTIAPTARFPSRPTKSPTSLPTSSPSVSYSPTQTSSPSVLPSRGPTAVPSTPPSSTPSTPPSFSPSLTPSIHPTLSPSADPSTFPSLRPTAPTLAPAPKTPTWSPTTSLPTMTPTLSPTKKTGGSARFE
jgi:DNA-binding beta-propeller fold protein YncE